MSGLYLDPSACQFLAFKPAIKALDFVGKKTREAARARFVFDRSSSLVSVMDVPNKTIKLARAFSTLSISEDLGEFVERLINVFKKFTSLLGVAVTSLQIAHKEGVCFLTETQFSFLDGIGFAGSVALVLKSGVGIKKNVQSFMASQIGSREFYLSLLKLVGRICGLVTGIFGMIAFAYTRNLTVKWLMLGVSTISLAISISKYYINSLTPESKDGININMI